MDMPLINKIALAVNARATCIKHGGDTGNGGWADRWTERLSTIERNVLPRGSGFDSGTKIDLDATTDDRIVFTTSFHHMDENGFYCGWSEHTVTVTPSFIGNFNLKVGGRNVRDIKDYIADTFSYLLSQPYEFETKAEAA